MANGKITSRDTIEAAAIIAQFNAINEIAVKVLNTFNNLHKAGANIKTPKQGVDILNQRNKLDKEALELLIKQERLQGVILNNKRKEIQLGKASTGGNTNIAQLKSLNSEYQQQSRLLNALRDRYKSLLITQSQGNKLNKQQRNELKRLETQVKRLDRALKQADAAAGQFNRNVGNYPRGLRLATRALRSFIGAFGFTSGIFLFASALKDAFTRVREFDKSMQNLAGILRVTREDVADVEAEIIKVAGASIKTSREVAGLAESLATLGKRGQDLIDLIKPANDLSIALGTTSEEAAEFLVQNLNAFGDSSSEAERYADVIATIRTSTSLDFQRMRDSFQYLTPISRILGEDLAFTGGIIGVLSDNSIKAEQGARLLGTAQQRLAKDGISLNDALNEINEAQEKGAEGLELLALASNLFGKQAAKVAIVLANNRAEIQKYANDIRGASGALDDLVNQQLESLDAQIKILDSTWERLILTIENGNGSFSTFFKGATLGLTGYLEELIAVEEAQSKIFEITGKVEENFDPTTVDNFVTILTGGLVRSREEYDQLVDLQREFNRYIGELDRETSLDFLSDELSTLNKVLQENNDLSEEERKLYEAKRDAVSNLYDNNLEYRKELEAQAREIVNTTGKFEEYGNKIDILSNQQLRDFIAANKDAAKSLKAIGDEYENLDVVTLNSLKSKLKDLRKAFGEADVESVEFQNLKSDIQDLEKEIARLEGRGEKGAKAARAIVQGTIAAYEKQISKLQEDIKFKSKSAEETLALNRQINDLKRAIENLNGAEAKVDIVLNSEGTVDFDRVSPIVEQFKDAFERVGENIDLSIEDVELPGQDEYQELADQATAAYERAANAAEASGERQKAILTSVLSAAQDLYGIDLQLFIENIQNKEAAFEDYAEASRQSLLSLNEALLDGTLFRLDQERDANRAKLDKVLNDENATEEQKQAAEARFDKKEAEIKRKQFEANKKAAIAQNIINTAVAITQAYAQLGPIGGTIAGAFITALSLIQLANIKKQKPPQFFRGKNEGDNYEGLATWNEHRPEVNVDKDGNVVFGRKRNELRYVSREDIIHPSIPDFHKAVQDPTTTTYQRVQKSLVKEHQERTRMVVMEQRIQLETTEFRKLFRDEFERIANRPLVLPELKITDKRKRFGV
jgi:hypothetical protein